MSLAAGSLMMGALSQSPGEASPPLSESLLSHEGADGILRGESLFPNKTLYVQPENPPLTSRLSSDNRPAGPSSESNAATSMSTGASQSGILPGILNDALTSALHSQPFNSPTPNFLPPPGNTLPAINNIADQNPAGQSPGTTISQSSSTGNGNGPASTGSSSQGGSSTQANNITTGLMAPPQSSPPSNNTPAPRNHGRIEPLQIDQQSQPTRSTTTSPDSTSTFTTLTASGGSGGSDLSVWIFASDAAADESGDPGEFTVERDYNVGDLTVDFSVGGQATEGDDYDAIGTTILLPDGDYSATVAITPIDDALIEGTEDVYVTLTGTSDPSYTIDGHGSDTVLIRDNDGYGGSGNSPPSAASETYIAIYNTDRVVGAPGGSCKTTRTTTATP